MSPMLAFFLPALAFAVPNFEATRDPLRPEAGKQYRVWLKTPGRGCDTWRKVKLLLPKEDMQLSESKRDEAGKESGCKFLWVANSAKAPGDMKFELESSTGHKQRFESPVAPQEAK